MSIPIVIPWLPVTNNGAVIASVQDTTAAGQSLILNSSIPSLPQGPYVYDRVIRTVRITRTNNPGAASVTITGIGSPVDLASGNPTQTIRNISEVLVTANNNTVESVNIYSQITSITTSAAITGISAGFGSSGITDYVFLDYNRIMFQTAVQLQFIARTALTATVYQTLSKPQTPNINSGNLDNFEPIPAFPVSAAMTGATTNQLDVLLPPATMTWATVSGTVADSLYFTVLQQGIR